MEYEITTLKPEDFEEMMLFLEKSYRHYRDYFPLRYPHVWRKDTLDYDNKLILKVNNKIVSHVGIFDLTLICGDLKYKVGGIGGVATLQEYRGRGFMSILMREAIKRMREKGYLFSILWGDRQRYGHFGYDSAGRNISISISSRSLRLEYNPRIVDYRQYYGEEELLRKIIKSHNKEPLLVYRNERDYRLIFNKNDLMTYVSENGSYISFYHSSPSSIVELGGEPEDVLSLIYTIINTVGKDKGFGSVTINLPYYPYDLMNTLVRVRTGWSIGAVGLVKILNLRKLIETYKPLLAERSRNISINFMLEIKDTGESVSVSIQRGDIDVSNRRDGFKKIALSEREITEFLFIGPEMVGITDKLYNNLFPLPFYVWRLDHI